TVSVPTADFVTGSGYLPLANAGGKYAAAAGTRADFTSNLSYDKGGVARGDVTLTFNRPEAGATRTNAITATQSTLIINRSAAGGTAFVTGRASLVDVTSSQAPVVIDPSAVLLAAFVDNGEPASADTMALTLLSQDGSLLFSSSWSGTLTS